MRNTPIFFLLTRTVCSLLELVSVREGNHKPHIIHFSLTLLGQFYDKRANSVCLFVYCLFVFSVMSESCLGLSLQGHIYDCGG